MYLESATGFFLFAFTLIYQVLVATLVHDDAKRRGMIAALWGGLVLFVPFFLIAYMVFRRRLPDPQRPAA
jgi:uncharacterized membrane protein YvlD (DUF360 family)